MEWTGRGPDRVRYTARDFKVCDLCGALNPVTNIECFVCGWSGAFHTDKETVQEAILALEREYGVLDESLFEEEVVPSILLKPNKWVGFWKSVKRFLSRE